MINAVELVKDTEGHNVRGVVVEGELLVLTVWTPPQQRAGRARLSEVRIHQVMRKWTENKKHKVI